MSSTDIQDLVALQNGVFELYSNCGNAITYIVGLYPMGWYANETY